MDFIERIFGISPDGGDGSIETMILGVVLVVVLALGFWRIYRRTLSKSVS
jgi:hypothetical protein